MEETHRSKEFPMRRIILAAIVATIGSSEGARAQCVDTLTMKSLWLYHQSVVDSKAKGAWDSTVFDPTQAATWKNVGPVSYAPYEDTYKSHSRTVSHPTQILFACGQDSLSYVHWVRITDSSIADPSTPGGLLPWRYVDSSIQQLRLSRSNISSYPVNGVNIPLSVLWGNDSTFNIGKIKNDSVFQGWTGSFLAWAVPKPDSLNWWQNAIRYQLTYPAPTPIRYYVEQYADSAVARLPVDSVGLGGIDTARAELNMYHYIFAWKAGTSAVLPRTSAFRGLSVQAVGQVVEIRLGSPAAVQILSPDGRVARVLPAAVVQTWDGRDAFGRKLSGVWIVRSEGLGAVPVVLR